MRWDEYRTLCERYDYFSRYALVVTRRALGSGRVHDRLGEVLKGAPAPKPTDHQGGPDTDYFPLVLERQEVQVIIECLAERLNDEDDQAKGRLSHLKVVWGEYATFLSQRQ